MECQVVKSEHGAVDLDLSGLQFADAAGVGLLLDLERTGARLHGRSGLVAYGTLRSLNIAESAGLAKELAHGYAAVCVASGVAPCHPIARLYERKAIALTSRVRDAETRSDVLLLTAPMVGLLLTDPARVDSTLAEAKAIAKGGRPVCINVHLRKTDFRKGSISM